MQSVERSQGTALGEEAARHPGGNPRGQLFPLFFCWCLGLVFCADFRCTQARQVLLCVSTCTEFLGDRTTFYF